MEESQELFNEVAELVGSLWPEEEVSTQSYGHGHGGKGFVCKSIFAFVKFKQLWIVLLCKGQFAFKEVSAEWLEVAGPVVLESPHIFVEYNRCHRITGWSATQGKGIFPVIGD